MGGPILVVNAGSSSIKFSAYGGDAARSATLQLKGQVDGIGSAPHRAAYDADGMKINERHWLGVGGLDYEGILEVLSGWAAPTDETLMIVRHTIQVLGSGNAPLATISGGATS